MKLKNNNSGAILILACIGLYVVLMLTAGFTVALLSELNNARRFLNSTQAFWLAQAGINRIMHDPDVLDKGQKTVWQMHSGTVTVENDTKASAHRVITSRAQFNGSERAIQIRFAGRHPEVFETTLSANGDLVIHGRRSVLRVNDKLRLNGSLVNQARYSNVFTEDMETNIPPARLTLNYPDGDNNGKPDEFTDFLAYNQDLLNKYPPEEVLYIKGNRTYVLTPGAHLKNKKLVYVEGDEGRGNVVIQFAAGGGADQDLTVIATGTVTFNQGGSLGRESRLNVMAWSGYRESTLLPTSHTGIIFTKGQAVFDEIHDTSVTNGSVIAGQGVVVGEVWSTKTFNYADVTRNDQLPLAFAGLAGSQQLRSQAAVQIWKEI